ncbi:hypothetical protein, partial [Vibrio hippocampi]|uniref:hypothetical protein n=1 Tax=Vibrio hippocampi TaxID=654686 RepID=UPI001F1581CD
MTQNIEQRTEVAVKKYEGASDTVNQLAETDAIVNTGAGTRKSFPKISQEWDDESNKLKKDWGDESSRLQTEWSNESAVIREDWQTERNELSTKALGVKPWESGQSETNINQQRRWTDNHTYLPKSVPAVMDAVGPDDNWIPYTAERAGVLSDVFGRKPIDLVVGLVITPNAKKQYPKLNAFGKVWELVDGTMTITVKAYQESSDGYLIVTLDDDSQVIGEQVEGATRSWSFSNLISAMKGGEPESELDNMNGSDQVLYRRNPNAPYVSVANRLRAQKLNLVGDLKAPDDNTGDVGQQIQEFLEFGGKKLEVPDGIFQVITPVLIHGSSGLSIEGFGPENTIFTAGSNLLMDTRRLESLDIDLHDEYNKHAIFHITQFDGENDRPGYAARNHVFSGIGGDFTGSPAEKIASLLSSPHLAHTEIKKTLMRAALSTYEAWNLSDNSSRHYHLLFKAMRSIDCIHHVKNDYKKSASTSFGTTWIFDDNSLSRCKYGYELHGLNYSTIRDSSVDNNLNGSYAVDIYKGRGIALRNVGIETRLHHIDTTTGGGILRVDNANVDIRAGFYVGGDRDGKG